MEEETPLAKWEINKGSANFFAFVVLLVAFAAVLVSFFAIYIVSRSTNIIFLVIPIILGAVFLGLLPEFFKSLNSYSQNAEVYITQRGVYLRPLPTSNKFNFLAWEQITQYDETPFISVSFLGLLFPKPTRFSLQGKYEEDSFSVEALGEDSDVLRAYLKEHEVPFGFVKNG